MVGSGWGLLGWGNHVEMNIGIKFIIIDQELKEYGLVSNASVIHLMDWHERFSLLLDISTKKAQLMVAG